MTNCPNCGRPLDEGQVCSCQSTTTNQTNGVNPKVLLIGGVSAVVIIAIVAIVLALLGSGNHMTPINNYIKLVNAKSTDPVKWSTVLMPNYAKNHTEDMIKLLSESDEYEDAYEDSMETFEEVFEEIDDEFDSWNLSFEVKSEKEIKEDDLDDYADNIEDHVDDLLDNLEDFVDDEDYIESLADSMDIDEDLCVEYLEKQIKFYESNFDDVEVTDGMKVKGKFIVKADDEEFKTDTVTLLIIKVNGQWCYYGLDDGDYLYSFDSDEEDASLFSFIFSMLNSRSYLYGSTLF